MAPTSARKLTPEMKEEIIALIDKRVKEHYVTRSDFKALQSIVKELSINVKELSEAQKRTEQRIEELTQAQKNTEKRVDTLAQRMEELAISLKETQIELKQLAHEHTITRKLLGDLTNTVGYGLEDTIMKYIYDYAQKEYGISINTVDRRYITYPDGRYDEINIYAEGTKNGNTVYIIGESKAQLGKKDADSFDKMIARLRNHLKGEIIPFIVCYSCAPDVENYIATQYPYIRIHKSFEFYKYKKQYD
jgi:hypothetical protein